MNKKKIIGLIPDHRENGEFSIHPHYALEESYFEAISSCGALPLVIPHYEELIGDYLDQTDTLIATGGNYAFPDYCYEDGEKSPYQPSKRAQFEEKLYKTALEKNIPILGICAGMQVIASMLGGKLTSNCQKDIDIPHKGENREYSHHPIHIEKDSLLYKIIDKKNISVNSGHQEAVIKVPKNMKISATAPDGTIEALEMTDRNNVLLVQWHPDFSLKTDENSRKIIKYFINLTR